uniref:Protein FAM76B n=1 Tax=Phallusia mammillata TaxID=59560 RepID=A0A6F9DDB4_9ASCI|nr:protein FAM76B [Phallusia mammillata]
MAQYACTKCLQWFRFDQLSEEKQICSDCLTKDAQKDEQPKKKKSKAETVSAVNCKYCLTDLKNKNIVNRDICDRCDKNFLEHGEPRTCSYCQLQSAFIGGKCQRCASSLKKYGQPINCHKCNLKAAFDHSKARIQDLILCWLCYVTLQKDLRKGKRKHRNSGGKSSDKEETKKCKLEKSTSPNSCDQVWKDLFGEDKDYRATNKPERARSEEKTVSSSSQRSASRDELRKKAQHNSRKAQAEHRKREKETHKHSRSSFESKLQSFEKTMTPEKSEKTSTPEGATGATKPDSNKSTPRLAVGTGESKSDNEASSTPSMLLKPTDRIRNGSIMELGAVPVVNDNNIVTVTKLREEISSLKKQLSKKDQALLEKDKQISRLKVEHLQEERSLQAKLRSQEEEFLKSKEAAMSKNHELLKKISQLSKGKA